MFSEDAERPEDVPHLSPLTKPQLATPLSFMPLSEEEQVELCVCVPSVCEVLCVYCGNIEG